ncbi:MAG TPA: hypothetical protein PLT47_00970 [Bacteroidales bacterium]|nr:hypothetical protein [Bacteroidales bacterium]HQI69291.1 hypothetical protein [Bacteroidales bacterium]
MKEKHTLFPVILLLWLLASCGPSKEEAISYNDRIINEQTLIAKKINVLYNSFSAGSPAQMDDAYQQALSQLDSGTAVVSKMHSFDGTGDFRDAALKLFALYHSVITGELKSMTDILKIASHGLSAEAKEEFNVLYSNASKKMEDGLREFRGVQHDFAEKHHIVIEKSANTP